MRTFQFVKMKYIWSIFFLFAIIAHIEKWRKMARKTLNLAFRRVVLENLTC